MKKCSSCNIDLDNKNTKTIAIEIENNKYFCNACKEVKDFLVNDNKTKNETINKDKTINIKNSYICIKCKNEYNGIKCNKCSFTNPLCLKKKKKK